MAFGLSEVQIRSPKKTMASGRAALIDNASLIATFSGCLNNELNVRAYLFVYSAQDDVSPFLRVVDKSAPVPSARQVRRLTTRTADVGNELRLPATLLIDQLLAGRETNDTPPATTKSLLLRSLVKRQPFQCLVNVVACWKR